MKINKISTQKPEKHPICGVLYFLEHTYEFNGHYKFSILGTATINDIEVENGHYHGNGHIKVKLNKESGICFLRFPEPPKRVLKPMPVPDVINEDMYVEQRIERIRAQLESQYRKDIDENQFSSEDFADYDDSVTPDDYVSELFIVDIEPEPVEIPEPAPVETETHGIDDENPPPQEVKQEVKQATS